MWSPSITFTSAIATDCEVLVALRVEAMRESLERIGRFDPARVRERFLSGFSAEYTRHVFLKNERAGFFVLKPQEDSLLLDHLYILPRHQNKGIGAAVLAHVFIEADAQNRSVKVGALRESDANRFYLKHGFAPLEQGEFDNYYLRPANQFSLTLFE